MATKNFFSQDGTRCKQNADVTQNFSKMAAPKKRIAVSEKVFFENDKDEVLQELS